MEPKVKALTYHSMKPSLVCDGVHIDFDGYPEDLGQTIEINSDYDDLEVIHLVDWITFY